MKFICDGLVLSDAAVTVSKACSTKTTTPVLECIKIGAQNDVVTLLAYDGEISIEKENKGGRPRRGRNLRQRQIFLRFHRQGVGHERGDLHGGQGA